MALYDMDVTMPFSTRAVVKYTAMKLAIFSFAQMWLAHSWTPGFIAADAEFPND